MNKTEISYIQLISNAINEKNTEIDFTGVNEKELIDLCRLHRNAGLVYSALITQNNAPDHMVKVFRQGFHIEMMRYSKRTTVFLQVLEMLNKQQIKHIIVKGMSYASCYPAKELRTMGDLDVIVRSEDIARVDKHLVDMGGRLVEDASNKKIHYYEIKGTNIEIHTSIGYAGCFNRKYDYEKYFECAIKESVQINNYTYEFNPYYKMVYAIWHIAKHFHDRGCGIRLITDFAVLIKAYGEGIDIERLWQDLSNMGLENFTKHLLFFTNRWFLIDLCKNTDKEYSSDKKAILTAEETDVVENYILKSGVFGHGNVSGDVAQIRKSGNPNYIISVFKWAFPSYSMMREISPWFRSKPAVLLPAAYIERALRNAKERGGFLRWFKKIKSGKKENIKHNYILKIMEL
jgi:hypothetical protein